MLRERHDGAHDLLLGESCMVSGRTSDVQDKAQWDLIVAYVSKDGLVRVSGFQLVTRVDAWERRRRIGRRHSSYVPEVASIR